MKNKPIIGITMGDAAGIGPELCLRALQSEEVLDCCAPVIFGSYSMLERVANECNLPCPDKVIPADKWDGNMAEDTLVIDCEGLDSAKVSCGEIQAECGAAAYDYIQRAINAAMNGKTGAVVTAPIHKEALQLAGIPFHGHTEMLAAQTNTKDYCMMLTSPEISVCLVTTHLALSKVPANITEDRIFKVIELAAEAIAKKSDVNGRQSKSVGSRLHLDGKPQARATSDQRPETSRPETRDQRPSLTVCGLNPHAGEHGIFGDEEDRIIMPAIKRARAAGFDITGPLPPDTAFISAYREKTDAYIVMYHDQGLIPFKMLAFDTGVNVTLGLPIVRTSVDHGTAFDIAWQAKASPKSMIEAIKTAVQLGQ